MRNNPILSVDHNCHIFDSNQMAKKTFGEIIFAAMIYGILALSILFLFPVSVFCTNNDPDLVRIGVLAKRGTEHCLEKWKPTAEYLTNKIPGHSFTIIPLGFDEIYSSVEHKEVDFILANSSFYVGLEMLYNINRIATIKEQYFGNVYCCFGGVIFHRADRKDIARLADLKGKSFMGVEETSFGGWQTAWRELREHGIDPYRDFSDLSFGGNHDAVVYAVRDGKVDVGTVRTGTLERMELEGKISLDDFRAIPHNYSYQDTCSLSFLHSTHLYPEWPFSKTTHISDDLAEEVAIALMKMSQDNPAAKAAGCAGWTIPHNYQSVHDCLKELRFGPYKDYGKVTLNSIFRQYWPWLLGIFIFGVIILLITAYVVRLNRKLGNVILEREKELTERKQAENKLRESEARLNKAQHLAQIGDWELDLITNTLYWSDEVYRMFDLKPQQFVATYEAFLDNIHPDDRAFVDKAYTDSVKNKTPYNIVHRLLLKDGTLKIVNERCETFYDDTGKAIRFVGTVQDITKRKQAENKLRENEEKFRTLYESSSDAIMLLNDKGFIDCNNATLKIFGCTGIQEFCSKHPADLSPPTQPCGTDSMTLANEQIAIALRKGSNQFEWIHQRIDGTPFSVEVSLTSLYLNNKGILLARVNDVTERKRIEEDQKKLTELLIDSNNKLEDALIEREIAEKNLSETVDRYTAMINTVPALMFIKDIEDKYIEVNEAFCRFVSKSKDKIIGKITREVHSKELAEKFYTEDKSVMENDTEIINKEEQYIDDGGNIRWISSSRIPLHDSDGKISGLVGLAQDITEQHSIQEQLTQSDKLAGIGQLAAGVAHEINNPIGYINSNLNTMSKYLKKVYEYFEGKYESTPEDLDDLKEMLEDFADAIDESMEGTNRVKQIVSDLKSFSRVDRAEKEHADINEGINTTLNVVWNEIKYKAEVKKEFGKLPELFCMSNQLNQVFMNLLINAAHAIEKDIGLITIKTWADDGNIYISIEDNGVGIPEKNVKKLFDPFFTTKEVGKGTGLGLSLSYDIIKKHKGFIDVKSDVGVGTVFTITLPLEGIDERKSEAVTC